MSLTVHSPQVTQLDSHIHSRYLHRQSLLQRVEQGNYEVRTCNTAYEFKTEKEVGKVGLMMVGFGGNNGSTVLGGILAHRHNLKWMTKKGEQKPTMYGSMTQCSTMKIGETATEEIFMKLKDILPMVDPSQLVITGWDINSCDIAQAMQRACVFDYDLQVKLQPYMQQQKPMKSIYYPDFIANNQKDRANNLITGENKLAHCQTIRKDIQEFRNSHQLKRVIVLWTANTERMTEQLPGVNDTYDNLVKALKESHQEIAPSTVFALAAMEEDCVFINGSPQNTIVQGLKHIPHSQGILIGNDFKTGQTKFKTSFIDFLVGAGIKPKSCVSYNHLGNNDGKNLSSEKQFRSKQVSKSECILDLLNNSNMYSKEQSPDHTVVIKYVPSAGDSKKAIDQYVSEIYMGGQHTFVSYNVCEDSLLAAGIIIDLIVLSELLARVSYKRDKEEWQNMKGIVSFLGYLTKAPESKGPIINSLQRQRICIENLLRVLAGLPLQDHLLLNFRL